MILYEAPPIHGFRDQDENVKNCIWQSRHNGSTKHMLYAPTCIML